MNKQELIDYCNAIKENKSQIINCIDVNEIIKKIEQLDEPQKVTVPQLVADWYEECKDDFEISLFQCIYELSEKRNDNELTKFEKWIIECETEPFQTLVNMHQFGYEVEKEKRYIVKAKGVHLNSCLVFEKKNKKWFFSSIYETDHQRGYHTRKELEEADFGWIFDCPGIEIEEVKG